MSEAAGSGGWWSWGSIVAADIMSRGGNLLPRGWTGRSASSGDATAGDVEAEERSAEGPLLLGEDEGEEEDQGCYLPRSSFIAQRADSGQLLQISYIHPVPEESPEGSQATGMGAEPSSSSNLHLDTWEAPGLFGDSNVSLPVFLVQPAGVTSQPQRRRLGWMKGSIRRRDMAASSNPGQFEQDNAESHSTSLFLGRSGDVIHGDRFHNVPTMQSGEGSSDGPVPQLELYSPPDLNWVYVMRPLRLGMWLFLLLLGYAASLGWCAVGLPQQCSVAKEHPTRILSDLAQILQMGFATGWFARIAHRQLIAPNTPLHRPSLPAVNRCSACLPRPWEAPA